VLKIPNPKIIDAKMDNGIKIKIFVLRPIKKNKTCAV
jgi:hypothetical protein